MPLSLLLLSLLALLSAPALASPSSATSVPDDRFRLSATRRRLRLHTPRAWGHRVFDLTPTDDAPLRPLYLHPTTVVHLDGRPRSFAGTPVAYIQKRRLRRHAIDILRLSPASTGVHSIRLTTATHSLLLLNTNSSASSPLLPVQLLSRQPHGNRLYLPRSHSCGHPDALKLRVRLSIAFDTHFCHAASSTLGPSHEWAVKKVHAVVNSVNAIYSSSTCVHFHISHIDGYCDSTLDPYTALSSSGMTPDTVLTGFVDIWTKAHPSRSQDLTFFLTGSNDGTSTAGRAFLSGVCTKSVAFGYCEGDSTLVLAHELGHSLGADHDSDGLMTATLNQYTEAVLSTHSTEQIAAFVDGYAKCLRPESSYDNTNEGSSPRTTPSLSALPSISSEPRTTSSDNIDPVPSPLVSPTPSTLHYPQSPPGWSCASKLSIPSSPQSVSDPLEHPFFPSCTGYSTIGHVVTSTGSVRVRSRQLGYTIKLELSVIPQYGLDIRVGSIIVRSEAVDNTWTSATGEDRRLQKLDVGLDKVPLPEEGRCCGQLVKLKVSVTVTRTKWNGPQAWSESANGSGDVGVRVMCLNPCRGLRADDGRVVLDDRCPTCEVE